jgi:UDP-N-acetylglucosamine 2-epimerase (non-hydrolysing)
MAQDITSTGEAIRWYLRLVWKSRTDRTWLRREVFPEDGICLIHGDTLSTLLGLQMARNAGLKVAHVEAGLRSFHWFDPFPEELIRIVCMKRADLLFAPSTEAENNLRAMRLAGEVVRVDGNTVADALRWIRTTASASDKTPAGPFALATCHRLETIANRHRLRQVVALLNRVAAETIQLVFVVHGPTLHYLRRFGMEQHLHPAIRVENLLDYGEFIALLGAARFVLSDGGSIQEECAYLDKPCLILRNKTERNDGLDRNAVLWRFNDQVTDDFLLRVVQINKVEERQLPQPSVQMTEHLASFIWS